MKLWLATGNTHKLEEVRAILGPDVDLHCQSELTDPPDVEETGQTYQENARLKARALWNRVHEPVIADDSGLEVDFLDGGPGIHSQRYSAPDPTHEKNIDKLLAVMQNVAEADRNAHFHCTLIYVDANGNEEFFTGDFHGKIAHERSGKQGFGFDPVFFLPERGCCVAELPEKEKNLISHRGLAVAAFRKKILG